MTDQELIGYLDRLDQKIDGLREENRQTRVMLEGFRSEIQLLAEGVIGQGESFAIRHTERAERQTRDVIDVIRERFGKH